MNLFLDCEFNGFGGELISMALVDERGQYFYEVLACLEPVPWVEKNVLPFLNKPAVSLTDFQKILRQFLHSYHHIHIIADWPEDLMHFTRCLILSAGKSMLTPPLSMQLWQNSQYIHVASEVPHNALSDAHALQQSFILTKHKKLSTK